MKKRTRAYLGTFIALSVAGLAVLAAYQYKRRSGDTIKYTVSKKTGTEVSGIRYTGTRGGRLVWELNADSARLSRAQDTAELDNIKASFYAASGSAYNLSSREGKVRESGGLIDAGGGVVVEGDRGERFVTERLTYAVKSREITAKGRVEFTSKGMRVTGSGLVADVEKERFSILRDVKAVLDNAPR